MICKDCGKEFQPDERGYFVVFRTDPLKYVCHECWDLYEVSTVGDKNEEDTTTKND